MTTDAEKPTKLKELIVKRSSIKGQITKFKNYLLALQSLEVELSSIELAELSLKLNRFEGLSVKFDNLQSDIEVLNYLSLDVEIDERDNIEHDIIFCIAKAKSIIENTNIQIETRRKSVAPEAPCYHNQHNQGFGFKLPQIQISKFDGACFRWLEFRDTFQSLIHTNERISDIHKFHYLISYLEADAARVISNLEVSSLNYNAAWSLLCKRYDNKRLLINYHISALLNVQQITRESERSLRFLVDHVTKNLRALSSLGQPTDKWDILLIFMLSSKLDSHSLRKWEELRNSFDDVPTLDLFHKFLTDRADVLETLNSNNYDSTGKIQPVLSRPNQGSQSHQTNAHNRHYYPHYKPHSGYSNKQERTPYVKTFAGTSQHMHKRLICVICNDSHKIYQCPTFRNKNYNEKIADVEKYNLCINCLRQGHILSECRLGPCMVCNKGHNTILHQDSASPSGVSSESIVTFSKQCPSKVVLSTAIVEVSNPVTGKTEKARALLDCGSQSSFITKSLKQKIQLNTHSTVDAIDVIGIGNKSCNKIVESCNIHLKSMNNSYNTTLSCLVMDELTGDLPKSPIDSRHIRLPSNIQLADPNFHLPANIDVLLGADIFWDVLNTEQYSLGPKNLKLINSKFGWLVAGPYDSSSSKNIHCNHSANHTFKNPLIESSNSLNDTLILQSKNDIVNKTLITQSLKIPSQKTQSLNTQSLKTQSQFKYPLSKIWKNDKFPHKFTLSNDEKPCENHFSLGTTRLNTGRFCARPPFIDNFNYLGKSYTKAKRRPLNLDKRFRKTTYLKSEYTNFSYEYADLGNSSESTNIVISTSPQVVPTAEHLPGLCGRTFLAKHKHKLK